MYTTYFLNLKVHFLVKVVTVFKTINYLTVTTVQVCNKLQENYYKLLKNSEIKFCCEHK